ncbi:MAG: hypothetical protein NC324_10715 [Bacteroides sp.]|nr:hypothetical protein [Bacteroides sp.]
MIPYQIGDTVHFADARGNNVTLTVTGEISEWDHYDEHLWEEYRTVYLQSEDSAYKLTSRIQGWYYGNHSKPLHIVFSSPFGNRGCTLRYNKGGNFRNNEEIYDSLIIGNRMYYDVAFQQHSQYSDDYTETWTIHYNTTHGVLQMTTDGKTMFTLQEYIPAR